jgi:hypothetical protein
VKNKILAMVVALTGLACLAMVPATSARTTSRATPHTQSCPSGTTAVGDYCSCPAGTAVGDYCTSCPSGTNVGDYCSNCPSGTTAVSDYCTCPSGTSVADYCTCPAGSAVGDYCENLSPEQSPTVYGEHLWGAKHAMYSGPALKFHLKRGLGGAPQLTTYTCYLPQGLSYVKSFVERRSDVSLRNAGRIAVSARTLRVTLRASVSSMLVYFKNKSLTESRKLRSELASGRVKSLKFRVSVTDALGKTTLLSFIVKPAS